MNTRQFTRVAAKLQNALGEGPINEVGRATGFAERLRKVTPHALAVSLICALASTKVETLADLLRAFVAYTGTCVAYKPFHNQLAKAAFPTFMKAVLHRLVSELLIKVLEPVPDGALACFSDIIIQDGSSFAVKDALKGSFPGRFTKISPAAVELHATMSLFHDQAIKVALSPDKQGERDFLPEPASLVGTLSLADRGYQDLDYCHAVDQAGGSFVFRFLCTVNPEIREYWVDGRRRVKYKGMRLQDVRHTFLGHTVDLDVVWKKKGARDVKLRLVLVWNPAPAYERHMYLMTNLDREAFSSKAVRALYSLRWQVELLFKEWKSYANLHSFDTSKEGIATGLIWASLAASLTKRFLAHATQAVFEGLETSTRRVAMAVPHHLPRLFRAILRGRGMRPALVSLMEFLAMTSQRAHPTRDRARGRLQTGLQPVMNGAG